MQYCMYFPLISPYFTYYQLSNGVLVLEFHQALFLFEVFKECDMRCDINH